MYRLFELTRLEFNMSSTAQKIFGNSYNILRTHSENLRWMSLLLFEINEICVMDSLAT